MSNELFLFSVLAGVIAWLAVRHALAVARERQQLKISEQGKSVQGRVVGIQQPFMLDACVRLYFDFVPAGRDKPLRACHIARCTPEQARRALPVAGSTVTVRYLPERPEQAVIPRLLS
jgi:hypothetical protein